MLDSRLGNWPDSVRGPSGPKDPEGPRFTARERSERAGRRQNGARQREV